MNTPLAFPPGHAYPSTAHVVETIDGVERFRRNRIINDLVDAARVGKVGRNLSQITVAVDRGTYTHEERAELYRLIGYSIDGFADVFPEAT